MRVGQTLPGKVALVTGASRGVGKGVAIELAGAGATVYASARTRHEGSGREGLPGSLESTVSEIESAGGICLPVVCDHTDEGQTGALFDRIDRESGQIDILVNSVWGGYENLVVDGKHADSVPFWEQPPGRWDSMFGAGPRAHYICSTLAASRMVRSGSGLIITISFWAAQKFLGSPAYGTAKAADDKMIKDMAHQLRAHNVTAVTVYPGLVRTEDVMRFAEYLDMSNSESPRFTGRAVVALASDPDILSRSGRVLVSAQLAREYGFTDIDGSQPRPLTLEEA